MSDEEEKQSDLSQMSREEAPYRPATRDPTMLYRYPSIGPDSVALEGDVYDTCIVDASEVDDAIAAGWFRIWTDAKAATQVAPAEDSPNRRARK